MKTYREQQEEIDNTVAAFPTEFGLRAFPGRTFKISRTACYHDDNGPVLYVYIKTDDGYLAFSKGTKAGLMKEIVYL